MAVDLEALRNHPGANPGYESGLLRRKAAQEANRSGWPISYSVPKLPNKYVPHVGKKQIDKELKRSYNLSPVKV